MQDQARARPQRLDAVDDALPERDRRGLVVVDRRARDLVEAEAEVRGLHQQLGVEREVERVAQERHLEQQLARERAVARVELGEVGAHEPVLGRRQPAVGGALPPRHAALDRAAGLEEARAEHDVGLAGARSARRAWG